MYIYGWRLEMGAAWLGANRTFEQMIGFGHT